MSKKNNLIKGSILRIIEFFVSGIIGFILMPFIIRSLGDKMYGLWIFVGSFTGYYALLELGLDKAIKRYTARALGSKDYKEVNKIINTCLCINIIIGLITLCLVVLTAFIVPILSKNISEVDIFRKVILILGLNLAIAFPVGVFSGLLWANIRYDISTAISLVKIALNTTLVVFFLKRGYGIVSLALISFGLDFTGYFVKYFLVKHLYKYLVLSIKFVDKSKIKSLFSYSFYTFIGRVADQLKFNIDNFVIVIFMGLSQVTLYSIGARLINYFYKFITAAIGILVPVFSQYEGEGDYKSLKEKFILTTKISGYISIFITSTLIVLGRAFIIRWVGMKYSGAYHILVILVIPAMLDLMQNPSIQMLYAISKHRFYALVNSIEGIVNLILSIILVKKFGLIGVALGTAIPMIIVKLLIQPIYVCRAINIQVRHYYFSILLPMILKSLVIIPAYWYIFNKFIVPDYQYLLLLLFTQFIIFVVIAYFWDLKIWEKYFKRIIFSN